MRFSYVLLSSIFLNICCSNSPEIVDLSPKGYQFSKGKKIMLSPALREISGICFYPGSDSLLMAVNDEHAKLYTIDFYETGKKIKPISFGSPGDYEDLAFFANSWMVLESKGILHKVKQENGEASAVPAYQLPEADYEGLAAAEDSLFVLCKDCGTKKPNETHVYQFVFGEDSLVKVGKTIIKGKSKDIDKGLFISALALHPVEKEWYILSHKRSMLIITDRNFNIRKTYKLPANMFLQPEGISFNSRGDMFISSEGKTGKGYVIKFDYEGY